MENVAEYRIPVYKLLPFKEQLKQLHSFSSVVDRCNFTTYTGWKGKTYVEETGHGVDEYRPNIRGVEILDICYLKLSDYVILTKEQYEDFSVVAGVV